MIDVGRGLAAVWALGEGSYGVFAQGLVASLAIGSVATWALTRRPLHDASGAADADAALVKALGVVAAIRVAYVLHAFQRRHDDYWLTAHPPAPYGLCENRLVSHDVLLAFVRGSGAGDAIFPVLAAVVLALWAAGVRQLYGRVGFPSGMATASTLALVALGPGLDYLLGGFTGFDQLLGEASVAWALACLDEGLAAVSRGRRLAGLALALWWVLVGDFCKYPTVTVAVPWFALWVWRVRGRPATEAAWWALAAFVVWLAPLEAAPRHPSDELASWLGGDPWLLAGQVAASLAIWAATTLLPVLVLRLLARRSGAPRDASSWPRLDARAWTLMAMAGTALAPFLANRHYWSPYYPLFAAVAVTPLAVSAGVRAMAWLPGRRGAWIFAALLLRPPEFVAHLEPDGVFTSVEREMTGLREAFARLTPGLEGPVVLVTTSCPGSAERMRRLLEMANGDMGIAWASGRADVRLERGGEPGEVERIELRYCAGEGFGLSRKAR